MKLNRIIFSLVQIQLLKVSLGIQLGLSDNLLVM